jgi:hypothetical protein
VCYDARQISAVDQWKKGKVDDPLFHRSVRNSLELHMNFAPRVWNPRFHNSEKIGVETIPPDFRQGIEKSFPDELSMTDDLVAGVIGRNEDEITPPENCKERGRILKRN